MYASALHCLGLFLTAPLAEAADRVPAGETPVEIVRSPGTQEPARLTWFHRGVRLCLDLFSGEVGAFYGAQAFRDPQLVREFKEKIETQRASDEDFHQATAHYADLISAMGR